MHGETDYIRSRIQHYGERGVFAGVREARPRGAKHLFAFQWLLGAEIELNWDSTKRELVFEKLLPGVAYPSFLDRELRRFTVERSAQDLPPHRRVDPELAALQYSNRGGDGSIKLGLTQGDAEYALKAALTFINDLFTWLHLYHIDYLHQHFGVPEE